ncbi:VOC family protein [Runella sp. MFBS21]|uniref:VOC family protein n=1 Tax=Runella sp. MFBS21 TaxID=3034018 RepID=UPI0023F70454|nr:VOC family protein [Runella sp. MFBS21]MDF7818445.1 VOC family protein [Runella sp. MFBS21]
MLTVNPYLNFAGNTEEVFNFYKSVFGGEFSSLQRFKDTPMAADMPAEVQEKIIHIGLPISNGTILMASDALESLGHTLTQGNNFYISLHPTSKEEATQLFNGLSEGGAIEMPLEDAFWGAYYGLFTDKFGIKWMINYHYPTHN